MLIKIIGAAYEIVYLLLPLLFMILTQCLLFIFFLLNFAQLVPTFL